MSLQKEKQYFEKSFKSREYLKNYYADLDVGLIERYVRQKNPESETARVMIFLAEEAVPAVRSFFGKKRKNLLELGGGPTLYQLFSLAEVVDEIHFTDYVEDNLEEIRKWLRGERNAFNWKPYAKAALMLKNDRTTVRLSEIQKLENLLVKKITKVGYCDIFQKDLGVEQRQYNVINTHFVAESATSSKAAWRSAIRNISNKLSRPGLLIMSALLRAKGSYKVLGRRFPAVELYEEDVRRELTKNGFKEVRIASMKTEDFSNNYRGFMFVIGEKQ